MVRSIPPGAHIPKSTISRPTPKMEFKVKRYMPHYTRMRITTLEKLLAEAQLRLAQMTELLKTDASNENLEAYDKLQRVVEQLTRQIVARKGK